MFYKDQLKFVAVSKVVEIWPILFWKTPPACSSKHREPNSIFYVTQSALESVPTGKITIRPVKPER
jgi:hypothetical protein